MRALRWFGLGAGALLGARVMVGCASDTGGEPFDAGPLPDVVVHDGSHADGSSDGAPAHDAGQGDTAVPTGDDGSTGADASDAALGADAHDAGLGGDAHDAAVLDAGDSGAVADASDGAAADAGDAERADSATFDASALCLAFDAGATNPIEGVGASDGVTVLDLNTVANVGNVDNGVAAAADTVAVTVWTQPEGIMADVSVVYTTNNFGTTTTVSLASAGASDAGVAGPHEAWTGSIPPQAAGAHVAWYALGHDACGGGVHYYSDFQKNFHYEAQ